MCTQPPGLMGPGQPNGLAFLLPGKMRVDSRKLKDDAPEEGTDSGNRVLWTAAAPLWVSRTEISQLGFQRSCLSCSLDHPVELSQSDEESEQNHQADVSLSEKAQSRDDGCRGYAKKSPKSAPSFPSTRSPEPQFQVSLSDFQSKRSP